MINYITYDGMKYPIRISYYAIKKFQEETGLGIEALDDDISHLEVLLYYALVAGHKMDKKEMKIEKDDMEFVLDECMQEFNHILISSFPNPSIEADSEPKKK